MTIPAANEQPVLDHRVLEEHRAALGGERVERVILAFLGGIPRILADLDQAAGQRDPDALARTAHRLASGALSLGLPALAAISRRTERQVRAGQIQAAMETIPEIRRHIALAMNALRAVQAGPGAIS